VTGSGKRLGGSLVAALGLALYLVVIAPATAQAATWIYYSGSLTQAQWHTGKSVNNYSQAKTVIQDPYFGMTAWVSVTGLSTSSALNQVTLTFSARKVTSKCRFTYYGSGGDSWAIKCSMAS